MRAIGPLMFIGALSNSAVILMGSTMLTHSAFAQIALSPAPPGDEVKVAQRVIHENFDTADCPSVVRAMRFDDGTIRATCSNGAGYRVFNVAGVGSVAMSCTAATQLGISGC